MNRCTQWVCVFCLCVCPLFALDKQHVAYLMQSQEIDAAISLYENHKREIGRHDFDILVHMATLILEHGIRSPDPTTQLSSLWGTAVANIRSSLTILEQALHSLNFETQLAAIQLLAHMQDNRGDELLTKAMASPFLMARMEAGFHLAHRRHRKATGHLEALMYKVPRELWFYFPQFFATIGTDESIAVLRQLMEEPMSMIRVESILNIGRFGRDDLLPSVRQHATHLYLDEQEACAYTLGLLQDSRSIPLLRQLAHSSSANVKLSALSALHTLGDTSCVTSVIEMARGKNLFAIALLGDLPGGEDCLASLLHDADIQVRFNAMFALLQQRDRRSLSAVDEFLLHDAKDLGFQPHVSCGHSLRAWKVVPSLQQHLKRVPFDLAMISLQLREQMLAYCLELPEADFLHVASRVFEHNEFDLVPLLVTLLENHSSPAAISLLKKNAERAGTPWSRIYCNLSLYRLQQTGPYEHRVRHWLLQTQQQEIVQFRHSLPWHMRNLTASYELTPGDSARLLLETFQALANRHDENGIDLLLQGIKSGHSHNRYALAGLLIQALQ